MIRPFSCLLAGLAMSVLAGPVAADPVADFYKGKTVTCYIGYDAGGGYDFFARAISTYMSRYIPGNPKVIPINMPGASTMVLANFLAKLAPRDGTAFGAVNSSLIFDPILSGAQSKAQFKGPDMTMIGNAASAAAVLLSSKASGVKTFEDLYHKELIIGAMTTTGDTYVLPMAVKKILHLDNLKIITGYPGSREALIALERGEIMGRVWDMEAMRAVRPDWVTDGSVNFLVQLAPHAMPEVPAGVPLAKDFVRDEDDKKVLDVIFLSTLLAKPFIAPPDMPADRVEALRNAFMATLKDPDLLADMEKAQITLAPMSGADFQQIVQDTYALPDNVIRRVQEVLAN